MSVVGTSRVVDAHVHFWDPSTLHYPWLDDEPSLKRPFVPADFAPLENSAVDAVVFVEANASDGAREVEWVERLAGAERRIVGIVAYIDLLDVPNREAALDAAVRSPLVVGVRHNIQGHDAGFALAPEFVRGVRDVAARDLPFDLCICARQMGEVVDLVERCPEARFVLDHCGKPAIRDGQFEEWAAQLARLAAHERVSCKLSGLLTESRADQRDAESLRPYAEHVVSCFGSSRVLYGSDWPVCTLGGGAEHWRAIVDVLTESWSSTDRQAFYGENATRFYGLELPAHA